MANDTFHVIEIKVPLPVGSLSAQNKTMATYEVEMEALRTKLPEGSVMTDRSSVTKASGITGKRPTMQEKIDAAVAGRLAEEEKRRAEHAAIVERVTNSTVAGGAASVVGGQAVDEEHSTPGPVHPAARASRSAAYSSSPIPGR